MRVWIRNGSQKEIWELQNISHAVEEHMLNKCSLHILESLQYGIILAYQTSKIHCDGEVIKLVDFEISPVNILKAIRSYLLGNGAYTKACSMKQD